MVMVKSGACQVSGGGRKIEMGGRADYGGFSPVVGQGLGIWRVYLESKIASATRAARMAAKVKGNAIDLT